MRGPAPERLAAGRRVSLGMADLFTRRVNAPTIALTSRAYRDTRERLVRRQAQGAVRP